MFLDIHRTLKINAIFFSIDGEVNHFGAGRFSLFIRLSGCRLKCRYCDTPYAQSFNSGKIMSFKEIITNLKKLNSKCKKVTITGGEPLCQLNTGALIQLLKNEGYKVSIETSGAIQLEDDIFLADSIVMDWKLPSSGEEEQMVESNLSLLTKKDYVKFLVGDGFDYNRMAMIIHRYWKHPWNIAIAPIYKMKAKKLIQWCKLNDFVNERFIINLQLHKIIWPDAKEEV